MEETTALGHGPLYVLGFLRGLNDGSPKTRSPPICQEAYDAFTARHSPSGLVPLAAEIEKVDHRARHPPDFDLDPDSAIDIPLLALCPTKT